MSQSHPNVVWVGTGEGNKGFDVTVTALEMVQTMRKINRRLSGESD